MFRTGLYSSIGAAIALLLIASPAVHAQDAKALAGTYCGELQTLGEMVAATTTLEAGADGRLVGSYVFDDLGKPAEGTLAERSVSTGLKRTLVWTDFYGSGELTISFTADLERFTGLWDMGYELQPDEPWNGSRCRSS